MVELEHHKTARFKWEPLRLTIPRELSASIVQFARHARPVLLRLAEDEVPCPFLLVSKSGVPYDENSVTISNAWMDLQKRHHAPWRPFRCAQAQVLHPEGDRGEGTIAQGCAGSVDAGVGVLGPHFSVSYVTGP